MRFSAILPVLLGLAAFILSLLCIFAGSKSGFMEDYAIVTLNTSQIGQSLLNASESTTSSNPFGNLINNITNNIDGKINAELGSLARQIGVHDWYSVHILDFCEGYYTPTSVSNATVSSSDIDKNITHCSNKTAFFHFNPTHTLQNELNKSGVSLNLTKDLDWPTKDIDKGVSALRVAQKAAFILYCIAAGLLLLAALASIAGIFLTGRLFALVNIFLSALAFLAILLASAITTVVAGKAAHVINKYGKAVGVSANKGNRFLVLTWVAMGLAGVNVLVWTWECVLGRRRHRMGRNPEYK